MVASLGVGVSFAVNGQKHILDPGLQPSTTLYDFLRGRTTYTASVPDPEALQTPILASAMPVLHVSIGMPVSPFLTLVILYCITASLFVQGTKSGCGEGGCGSCSVEVYQYHPSSGDRRVHPNSLMLSSALPAMGDINQPHH